jgi:hypothetical protein
MANPVKPNRRSRQPISRRFIRRLRARLFNDAAPSPGLEGWDRTAISIHPPGYVWNPAAKTAQAEEMQGSVQGAGPALA